MQEHPFRFSRTEFIPTPCKPINDTVLTSHSAESSPFKSRLEDMIESLTERMAGFVSLHPTVVQTNSWSDIVLVIVT